MSTSQTETAGRGGGSCGDARNSPSRISCDGGGDNAASQRLTAAPPADAAASPMQIDDDVPGGSSSGQQRRQQREAMGRSVAAISEYAESAFVPQRQQQQQQQEQQQTNTGPANVGELVAKAKKAAVSLWMILHAQNCRLPEGTCAHRACAETKRLLVHVKTCPAGPNFPCPSRCKGCNETRKLLAHYRRCKDMRMKQVGSGRRSGLQPDQSCLVCSLMARYARGMMDRDRCTKSPVKARVDVAVSLLSSSAEGKFNVERGLAASSDHHLSSADRAIRRTPSMTLMPPPPPRSRSISVPTSSASYSPVQRISPNESFGSPPNGFQLMQSKMTAVAAAVNDPHSGGGLGDPSLMLGRSVDSSAVAPPSSSVVPFPSLRKTKSAPFTPSPAGEAELLAAASGLSALADTCVRRQRAESYDERRYSPSSSSSQKRRLRCASAATRVKFAPGVITSERYFLHDEYGDEHRDGRRREDGCIDDEGGAAPAGRPRSASCDNMSRANSDESGGSGNNKVMMMISTASATTNGCETIAEEVVVEQDETVFDMD